MRKWTYADGYLMIDDKDVAALDWFETDEETVGQFIADACNAAEQQACAPFQFVSIDPRRVSYVKYKDGSEDWHISPRGQAVVDDLAAYAPDAQFPKLPYRQTGNSVRISHGDNRRAPRTTIDQSNGRAGATR